MQAAQVQSLVGELRSHMPHCVAKKKKKKKRTKERKSKFIFNSSNSFSSQQQGFQRENVRNSVSRNSGCLFLLSVSYHRGLVPPQCLGFQVLKFCLWWYDHVAECTTNPPVDLSPVLTTDRRTQVPGGTASVSWFFPRRHHKHRQSRPASQSSSLFSSTSNTQHFCPASQYLRIREKCFFHSPEMETWPSCASLPFWRNQSGRWTTMVFPN